MSNYIFDKVFASWGMKLYAFMPTHSDRKFIARKSVPYFDHLFTFFWLFEHCAASLICRSHSVSIVWLPHFYRTMVFLQIVFPFKILWKVNWSTEKVVAWLGNNFSILLRFLWTNSPISRQFLEFNLIQKCQLQASLNSRTCLSGRVLLVGLFMSCSHAL
jgi:hypothetical protein